MQFVHDTSVSSETLWRQFAFEHATVPVLARRHHISPSTVHRRLDDHAPPDIRPVPRDMVAVADATYIGGSWMLVVRDPHGGENVYQKEVSSESTSDYQIARAELEAQGFKFHALVGDGRMALPWAFAGIPFQMCHFHMEAIVIRYTTLSPNLPAGVELRALLKTLARTDEASFTDAFTLWCRTWNTFLQEKTFNPETGKKTYTHRRLRSARDSVKRHLPFLFTFERYPDLDIPNTTNSLDGFFKKVKMAVGIHSGLTHARKLKLITTLLSPTA
jgi:hypothetical protein